MHSIVNILFVVCWTLDYIIYGLVTLTMYHLYLGLAFVNKKYESMQNVRRKQVIALIVFILMCIANLLILIQSLIDRYWAQQLNDVLDCIVSSALFIVSTIIFIKMQM